MEKIKILFVGAGVSNLVAANRLLDYSITDFVILEKGNDLKKRRCIGENNFSCLFCKDGCSTTEGVGGANALHGNKLCYFPASSHITKAFNQSEKDNALNYLNGIAPSYFDVNFNSYIEDSTCRKRYNSDVFNSRHFSEMIYKLTSRINNSIITKSNVSSIKKINNFFEVLTEAGDKYICEKLVLGTGRSSYKSIKTIFDDLGVNYQQQIQDIGIRIESHKENFSQNYYYQVDPKFKFKFEGLGQGRTFCAHNQGYVVPVRFGNSFYADGAFGDFFSENNNIALMVRGKRPLINEEIEEWCLSINSLSNNQLILGELNINDRKDKLISQIMEIIPSFPTQIHKQLMHLLLNKLLIGKYNIIDNKFYQNNKLFVYGPAIDRYWVVPQLNNNFSLKNNENLFVLGDAAGISRGFIQAMFSGVAWADKMYNEIAVQKKSRMVRFGVAGYPIAFSETPFKKDRMKIFEWLRSIDLDAFEAQMTYGPKTSIENCKKINLLSKDLDIKVSVHVAYYIVLTSSDKEKIKRSKETLKKTYELADLMGADTIVLHPGPLYGEDPKIVLNRLGENLESFFSETGNSHIGLFLETAGKIGQLGSVEEILYLSENIRGCFPCIDFGHVHARERGSLYSPEPIDKLFDVLKDHGVFNTDHRVHFHYTPIHYGPKGEITHKAIEDTIHKQQLNLFDDSLGDNLYHPRYEHIIKNISSLKKSFTIISETHNSQERGAKAMKELYKKLMVY